MYGSWAAKLSNNRFCYMSLAAGGTAGCVRPSIGFLEHVGYGVWGDARATMHGLPYGISSCVVECCLYWMSCCVRCVRLRLGHERLSRMLTSAIPSTLCGPKDKLRASLPYRYAPVATGPVPWAPLPLALQSIFSVTLRRLHVISRHKQQDKLQPTSSYGKQAFSRSAHQARPDHGALPLTHTPACAVGRCPVFRALPARA